MIEETLSDVMKMSTDLGETLAGIAMPGPVDISLDAPAKSKSDIFSVESRKSWEKVVEARCDFTFRLRITRRADTYFVSIWQKSVFGRTLTDIKGDDDMVPFFVENMVATIRGMLGNNLSSGTWAVVTTPMRRHRERNFASRIAEGIAAELHLPFYFDCAHCHSRHRVNAEFSANNIPREPNVIVFDDFVTTGSTLSSMREMLEKEGKTTIFFAGINNKL